MSSTSVISSSTSNNNSDGSTDEWDYTIIIVVCLVGAAVLFAGAGAIYYCTQGNKSVTKSNVEMSSGQSQPASSVQHQRAI